MKIFLVVVSLAVAALAEEGEVPITADYHEDIGIPAARAIRLAEFGGGLIVGGSVSNLGEYPYFGSLDIALVDGKNSVCGSSLLSNTNLVTSAHCWRSRKNQGRWVTVVLGSVRLYSGGTRIITDKVELHGSYNPNTLQNDVAMITIDPVEFSDAIQPIAIATGSDDYAGVTAMVVGFGRTRDHNLITIGQVLRNVTVQVITNAECRHTYGRYIFNSTLCTSTAGGTRATRATRANPATCQGDSGGPVSVVSGNERLLIGIVSFGAKYCDTTQPKASSRVTSNAPWINERI